MKSLLITFGCSWTFGVGAGYQHNMTDNEWGNIAWNKEINDKLSYRGVLAQEFDLDNISFAVGGSSNQKQFRLAKTFFTDRDFAEYSNVVVLWAITSTARNELYSLERNRLVNFSYHEDLKLARALVRWSFDHTHEVAQLSTDMLFWNDYFVSKNIKNLWLDTFNHHDYPVSIPNLVGNNTANRDMLSQLALTNGMTDMDTNYHLSKWNHDSNKIPFLTRKGILNPISYHPTALGHQQIAAMLKPSLSNLLQS
jgi:hypothetical protein